MFNLLLIYRQKILSQKRGSALIEINFDQARKTLMVAKQFDLHQGDFRGIGKLSWDPLGTVHTGGP
ncbi:hypothetical protein CQ12_09870 [Bradyrhizobium jicamae]|uniref:Uncharacterized protein n=1 Tax=Bradyrhizobium jicamae TaxID=280332 RepID=A0A0R3M6W0_9BRAD|nr:hypothetical protein [Bradyrhizobium jicamae]KRR13421.1 hypothetical protein CQ12_09870 [Bradyrhizobium jicamae]